MLMLLQKNCEHCVAISDIPKVTISVSKLKRKLGKNTQSQAATQNKQARVTSCDKLASRSADVCHSKLGLIIFLLLFCAKCLKFQAQGCDGN
jgi:lipopolysaccharide/colanic/teichoic acid biosynthesis glycosyltransferase